jgi:hypothetical protein
MPLALIVAEGLAVGVLTGLVGVGGGFLIVPALVLLGKVPMKQAVGTSLLVIAMKSAAGFLGYLGQVEVPWAFMALFTAVAVVGILGGTYLVRFVPQAALKRAFAVFLLVMGGFILYQNRASCMPPTAEEKAAATRRPAPRGPASVDPTRRPKEREMILKRFYDEKLAQASYLVGCAATGEALVVDPNRDVEQYVAAAEAEGCASRTSPRRTSTPTSSPAPRAGGAHGRAALPVGRGRRELEVRLRASTTRCCSGTATPSRWATCASTCCTPPGHTPEHLSFVVTDTAGADRPMGVFTGDFVFVGDVGRPDLLERRRSTRARWRPGRARSSAASSAFKDSLPGLRAALAGPRRGQRVRQGAGRGAADHARLREAVQLGLAHRDEEEFVRRCSPGSRSRRCTSRR